MIGLYFLIGALALFLTILLFSFVGCTVGDAPDLDEYDKAVMKTVDLVAYWRLGEPGATPVPSSGGTTKEELGGHNGDYGRLVPAAANDQLHSPATDGNIDLGVTPGLLTFPQSQNACINTHGGHIQVPWAEELNSTVFTFEAWVLPDPTPGVLDPRYFYCLVESTGPQGLTQKKTGWGLYLGPSDINNPDPAGPLFWQVWMGDGNQLNRVAIAIPDFPAPGFSQFRLTYLALTFDGSQRLQLFLYFPVTDSANENSQDLSTLQALGNPVSPIIFRKNGDTTDGHGDFFIGTGSNLTLIPFSGDRLYPFQGKIDEVAFYKKDLSGGIVTALSSHVLSAGYT